MENLNNAEDDKMLRALKKHNPRKTTAAKKEKDHTDRKEKDEG